MPAGRADELPRQDLPVEAVMDADKIAAILRDYRDPLVTVRDIVMRHSVGRKTLMGILRRHHVPLRGKEARMKSWPLRAAAKLATGYSVDAELENAKRKLRTRGRIVYGAEVTNGPQAKGLIKCDGRLMTREQLIEMARAA